MYDTIDEKGWAVSFYWVCYIILTVQIFLNIVIAVLFEKLEQTYLTSIESEGMTEYKIAI
jgi:hypothetical protein